MRAEEPRVVELTQTPCQFLEVEAGDFGFESSEKADCERTNAETGAERLAGAKVLKLKPGDYIYSCPLNPTPNYRIIVEG